MYTLTVSAATAEGDGLGPALSLHPDTATGPLINLDVNISGFTDPLVGSIPGPLLSLADALSSVAPGLLHVNFSDYTMRGAVTIKSKGYLGGQNLTDTFHISLWDLTHGKGLGGP